MAGMVRLHITGSDLPKTMQKLANSGITIYNAQETAAYTVCITLERRDFSKAIRILEAQGDAVERIGNIGIYWPFRKLFFRPVLMFGVFALILLTLYLPTRVLFVTVEGNHHVPSKQILEAAGQSGIYFGASRVEVRSEKVKNRLLHALPQLQWAGVNTRGCTAVITVRERTASTTEEKQTAVSHVVASKDGVILSCTATAGNLVCQPGEAVKKGQILISGYTDCGLLIRIEAAKGHVYAHTRYKLLAVTPAEYVGVVEEDVMSRKFTLLLGKKRINLWKGSGNTPVTCGRMYEEYYITLPGGYQLPFGIAVQTDWQRTLQPNICTPGSYEKLLEDSTREYLLDHMVDGTVLTATTEHSEATGLHCLTGSYICTEMIGRTQAEQIGENNE